MGVVEKLDILVFLVDMDKMFDVVMNVVEFMKVMGYEGWFMILCYLVDGEKLVIEFEELIGVC